MRKRQVTAILLSAIMVVSACMPMNGISVYASENSTAGIPEAAVTEVAEADQAEASEGQIPAETSTEAAVKAQAPEPVETTDLTVAESTESTEAAEAADASADEPATQAEDSETTETPADEPAAQAEATEATEASVDEPAAQAEATEATEASADEPAAQAEATEATEGSADEPAPQAEAAGSTEDPAAVTSADDPAETTPEEPIPLAPQADEEHTLTAYIYSIDEEEHWDQLMVSAGKPVTLEVTAYTSGGEAPAFAWYEGSTSAEPMAETGNTCTVIAPEAGDNATYLCVVSDDYGNKVPLTFELMGIFSDEHENVSFETAEEINPGDAKNVTVSSSKPYAYYKFVPATTGTYKFYSESDVDTYGTLYDSSENVITENDDVNGSRDFCIEAELTAGETYYYMARCYNEDNDAAFFVYLVEKTLSVVTSDDESRSVAPGEEVTLEVSANSVYDITYTWIVDNVTVDCTDSSYTFTPEHNSHVSCEITDGMESYTVDYTINIDNDFGVTANVEGVTENNSNAIRAAVDYNTAAVLCADVTADDMTGLTYYWYDSNGVAVEGENGATFTTEPVVGPVFYSCTVTDRFGNAVEATFDLYIDNQFEAHPEGVETTNEKYLFVESGSQQTLKVIATMVDYDGLTYEWYKFDDDEWTWEDLEESAEQPDQYSITAGMEEQYKCRVCDKYRNEATLYFYINPSEFDNNLNAYTLDEDDEECGRVYVSWSSKEDKTLPVYVTAVVTDGITYQWYYSSDESEEPVAIDGAVSAEYILDHNAPDLFRAGTYLCRVTDFHGSIAEVSFIVTIDQHENVSFDTAEEIKSGEAKNVTVSGSKPYAYYKFVPATTGTYKFYSESDVDTYGTLYDSSENVITENDDVNGSRDFCIEAELTAGETYYYMARCYNEDNDAAFFVYLVEKTLSVVTSDDESRSVAPGEEVTLEVSANSVYDITYTWIVDNVTVDCTDSSYTFTPEKNSHVSCEITDGMESHTVKYIINIENNFWGTANVAGLTENNSNAIRAAVDYNTVAVLCADVTADDMTGLTYYWYDSNEEAVEGATGATFTTEPVVGSVFYGCIVTDRFGNTVEATFDLYIDNQFEAHPEGVETTNEKYLFVESGSQQTLKVIATMVDYDGLTYEWYKYDDDEWTWEDLEESADQPEQYSITAGMDEQYRCRVCDKYRNGATLYFYINPSEFDNNLNAYTLDEDDEDYGRVYVDCSSEEDKTLPVYVTAEVTDGITYQWYYSSDESEEPVAIDGAVSSEYTLNHNDLDLFRAGTYMCRVTDFEGTSVEVTFIVTIRSDLDVYVAGESISDQWAEYKVPYGEGRKLAVEVSGSDTENITYQWYMYTEEDGREIEEAIEGETTASYEVNSITAYQKYVCCVTDRFGNVYEVSFTVTVNNEWKAYARDTASSDKYIIVPFGEPSTLAVSVFSSNSSSDITQLKYTWIKEYFDDNLGEDVRTVLSGDPDHPEQYTVDQVTEGNRVICEVSDQYGNKQVINFWISFDNQLKMEPSSDPQGSINKATNKYTVWVEKGSTVTLKCNASAARGNLRYQWMDWSMNEYVGDGENLTISSVKRPYEYTCYVYDDYGHCESEDYCVKIQNHLKVFAEGFGEGETAYILSKPGTAEVELHAVAEADEMDGLSYYWEYGYGYSELEESSDTLKVEAADAIYRCTVTDKYGNSKSVDFHTSIDNSFVAYPEGAELVEGIMRRRKAYFYPEVGDTLTLRAIANAASGELHYKWYVEDYVDVGETQDFLGSNPLDNSGAELEIKVSGTEMYVCTVSDDYGNFAVLFFYIRVGFLNAYPEANTSTIKGSKGETKELTVITEAPESAVIRYEWVSWDSSAEKWLPLESAQMDSANKLTIELDETREYGCRVKDQYGNTNFVYFIVYVDVLDISTNVGDGYYNTANEYYVEVGIKKGEEIELIPTVKSDDPNQFTYIWYIPTSGGDITVSSPSYTAKGGEYNYVRCAVMDKDGKVWWIFYDLFTGSALDVQPDGPTDIRAVEGEMVTLGVTATAVAADRIVYWWYDFYGNLLGGNAKCNVFGPGVYRCNVSDGYSNDTVYFYVRTSIPINRTQITVGPATYDGEAKEPAVTVKMDGKTLVEGSDYTISGYSNNVNAGTASVIITGKGGFSGEVIKEFTIAKKSQTPVCTVSTVDVGNSKAFSITGSVGKLTATSSDTKVATVSVSGTQVTVKGVKVGTINLTLKAAGDGNTVAATTTCTVNITPKATTKFTAAAAGNGKGIKLTWKKVAGATQYLIYRNKKLIKTVGNVATYTDAGANTNGKKYTFVIKAKASTGTSSQSKSVVYYKVNRPTIKKLTNSASKKMTVKWAKNSKATGYEIQYGRKKNFSGAKTAKVTKKSTITKTISKLTKGKTYYVRIRTYKKVGSTIYYSAWSTAKKIKITK